MFSPRLRHWLVALALLGLGACELNPQPDLPGSRGAHEPAAPGADFGPDDGSTSGGSKATTPQPGEGATAGGGPVGTGGSGTLPPSDEQGGADGSAGSNDGKSSEGGDGGDAQGGAR